MALKTSPKNADTDNDGMDDLWESEHGLNALVDDANDDRNENDENNE